MRWEDPSEIKGPSYIPTILICGQIEPLDIRIYSSSICKSMNTVVIHSAQVMNVLSAHLDFRLVMAQLLVHNI